MFHQWLVRHLVRGGEHPEDPQVRLACGSFAASAGIVANLFVCLVKMIIGVISGSIAIAADGINNLSDAGSSLISVIAFKISAKPADREHPFGHGRTEYLAGMIVAVLILVVGIGLFKESVTRILHPAPVHLEPVMFWIVAGTLLVKLWMFGFYRSIGKMIDSQVLYASAMDSLGDVFATTVVLIASVLGKRTGFPVDGCAGMLVAGLVVFAGIGILKETAQPLLGELPDEKVVQEMRERLLCCQGVRGVHDIIMHNYGPGHFFATAHVEIDSSGDRMSAHDLLEHAEIEIGRHLPVQLLLHADPFNTNDPTTMLWRGRMESTISEYDAQFKLYDFLLDASGTSPHLEFHLLIPHTYPIPQSEITAELQRRMQKFDPGVTLAIEYLNAYVADAEGSAGR